MEDGEFLVSKSERRRQLLTRLASTALTHFEDDRLAVVDVASAPQTSNWLFGHGLSGIDVIAKEPYLYDKEKSFIGALVWVEGIPSSPVGILPGGSVYRVLAFIEPTQTLLYVVANLHSCRKFSIPILRGKVVRVSVARQNFPPTRVEVPLDISQDEFLVELRTTTKPIGIFRTSELASGPALWNIFDEKISWRAMLLQAQQCQDERVMERGADVQFDEEKFGASDLEMGAWSKEELDTVVRMTQELGGRVREMRRAKSSEVISRKPSAMKAPQASSFYRRGR
jgi:hypothetical protein